MLDFSFFCVFDAMCMVFLIGFANRPALVTTCFFVLFSCVFDAMCMIFSIGLADRQPLAAICVFFCFSCVFDAMSICFFDRFSRQANI